ncbi:MAG: chromate transporter [Rhodospirillales bacterium]|nr:chromate transporter [Rhodospirillales bacterium]
MHGRRGGPPSHPRPGSLFVAFLRIGAESFGGGLSAWIRREVVEQRGWMSDRRFLSALALCQILPGANAVNLAVFIGTTLGGAAGAAAAFAGLMALPAGIVLVLGVLYAAFGASGVVDAALAGAGIGAIGLTLAVGVRLARRNVRDLPGAAIMAATALAVGVLRLDLLAVLAVLGPVSLAVARFGPRR